MLTLTNKAASYFYQRNGLIQDYQTIPNQDKQAKAKPRERAKDKGGEPSFMEERGRWEGQLEI